MGPTRSRCAAPFRPRQAAGAARLALASLALGLASAQARESHAAEAAIAQARITAENYDLHLGILYGVLATFALVCAAMLLSLLAHRRAARAQAPFHRAAITEVAWNTVPWIILFASAWPATALLAGIRDTSNADITIRATGLQWKWGYEYREGEGKGIAFDANLYAPRARAEASLADPAGAYRIEVDNPVVVPVNRKIRVVLAANDEIHSWHVPTLGVKQLAVPGLLRETWFVARRTGTYRGLCDPEACGAGRACVLIVVKVVSDDDYAKWVRRKQAETADRAGLPAPIGHGVLPG